MAMREKIKALREALLHESDTVLWFAMDAAEAEAEKQQKKLELLAALMAQLDENYQRAREAWLDMRFARIAYERDAKDILDAYFSREVE